MLVFFASVANGLTVVFLASLFLIRELEQPSFVMAVWCCVKGLRAHVGFASGSVFSSGLLSVLITPIFAEDSLLRYTAHRANLCGR